MPVRNLSIFRVQPIILFIYLFYLYKFSGCGNFINFRAYLSLRTPLLRMNFRINFASLHEFARKLIRAKIYRYKVISPFRL